MKTNHHNAAEFLLGVMKLEILKATGGVDGKAEEERIPCGENLL